ETRESGYAALGTAMKPLLGDVDDLKMKKIEECCANAVVVAKPAAASKPTAQRRRLLPRHPRSGPPCPRTSSAASERRASAVKNWAASGPRGLARLPRLPRRKLPHRLTKARKAAVAALPNACLEEIYDKIGDAKVGDSAKACLTAIAEACSLDYVGVQLAQTVFKLKNPKNQSEALNWLAQSVLEFGLRIPPKELIKYVRQGFAATNPAIRQAAISLTPTRKPALLQQIDQEIEQIKDKKPPAPTRGLKHAAAAASGKSAGKAAAGGGANADAGDDDEDDAAGVEDLVPRVDLADKLTDATVAKLGDSNWKIRKEGLDEVRALLNECRLVTSNLGELPERLRQRLADSNKVLCSQAMEISEALAPALGKRHAKNPAVHRPIVSGIVLNGMSDAKPRQRQIACQALNAWCEQVGLQRRACQQFLTCLSDRSGRRAAKSHRGHRTDNHLHRLGLGYASCEEAARLAKAMVRAILDKEREKAAAEAPTAPAPALAPPPPAASSSKPSSQRRQVEMRRPGLKIGGLELSGVFVCRRRQEGRGARPFEAEIRFDCGSVSAPRIKKLLPLLREDARSYCAYSRVNKMREQRLSDEKKRKVLRWDFSGGQPERDHIQQLQRQMTDAGFSSEILGQLFHQDFRQHIKGLSRVSYLDNGGDDAAEGHRCNVDLILKWSAARFYDTNPSMVDAMLRVSESPVPTSKLFLYFMDGLAAKSAKQRQECLDELGKIIQAMKAIAKQIGDRRQWRTQRRSQHSVSSLSVHWRALLKMVEPMQEKDRSMLEERIRRQGSSGGALSGSTADIPASSARESTPPKSSGVGLEFCDNKPTWDCAVSVAAPAQVNSATITRRGGGGGGGGGEARRHVSVEAPELDPMPVVPGDSERKTAEEDLTLKSSPDAFTAITHVITQSEDRCKLLSGHVDPILLAVTNQISLNTEPADPVGTLDLLRSLLYCLSTVFHVAVLAKCAAKTGSSAISLGDLGLADPAGPSDADHVNRTVNQLCASVIANADRTRVLLSLLRSLYECVDRVGFSQLFTELNIKCLWRITRELDKHVAEYDWDSVLAECNAFLTSFPLESWQQPDGDALCGRLIRTDLKPYLSKASAFFNRYIEQGLRSIEKERLRAAEQQQQQQQAVSALMSTGGQLPKGSGGQLASEMLAKLREFERTHLLNHSQRIS
uniref:VHS domain-containing protein n=1 Tax=Macrostomum lignano TaxID=282301 RepID=A0A1I8FNL3_9PLAT